MRTTVPGFAKIFSLPTPACVLIAKKTDALKSPPAHFDPADAKEDEDLKPCCGFGVTGAGGDLIGELVAYIFFGSQR